MKKHTTLSAMAAELSISRYTVRRLIEQYNIPLSAEIRRGRPLGSSSTARDLGTTGRPHEAEDESMDEWADSEHPVNNESASNQTSNPASEDYDAPTGSLRHLGSGLDAPEFIADEPTGPVRVPTSHWVLQFLDPTSREPRVERVTDDMTIGRGKNNTLVLPRDTAVSRRHALLRKCGFLLLQDEGSKNGTFVNNQRVVAPQMLRVFDVIRVGDTYLLVNEESSRTKGTTLDPKMSGEIISERLIAWRQIKQWSIHELALELGVSDKMVLLWETNTPIPAAELHKLYRLGFQTASVHNGSAKR